MVIKEGLIPHGFVSHPCFVLGLALFHSLVFGIVSVEVMVFVAVTVLRAIREVLGIQVSLETFCQLVVVLLLFRVVVYHLTLILFNFNF